jgi:glycosyltransferase involved in cell wall biosynthesis
MQNKVKFTIIIPTRERADTLEHCLRTLVTQDYDNAVFIVSDNFSQDNTKEVVESFDDPRIHYINTGKRVSMSHNWEFALGHVTDGWVSFLGDDDGILPGGLTRVAQVINETGCQAITTRQCYYSWPNSICRENQLRIPVFSGIEIRQSNEWLEKVMHGLESYTQLPWLYASGFVEICIINRARNRHGKFFLSMTPDVYSAIALALVIESYVFMNDLVSISGASLHSTGTATFAVSKNIQATQKFLSEENILFHPTLGNKIIKSITLLTYECYLQAEHLHTHGLEIDIPDQLALARAQALSIHYEEVRSDCDEIAHRNDINIKEIEKKEKLLRFRFWFKKFGLQSIRNFWQTIVLNGKDFDVNDIYSAAILANFIYVFYSDYKYWRWRKLFATLISKNTWRIRA